MGDIGRPSGWWVGASRGSSGASSGSGGAEGGLLGGVASEESGEIPKALSCLRKRKGGVESFLSLTSEGWLALG